MSFITLNMKKGLWLIFGFSILILLVSWRNAGTQAPYVVYNYIDTTVFKASPILVATRDAANYAGKFKGFDDKVYSHKNIGDKVLVYLGAEYPSQPLTLVLKGRCKSLANNLDGKFITVVGVVTLNRNKPEIIVTNPSQILIDK